MAKAFVIDDDPAFAKLVRDCLLLEKHSADICHDGGEALERLKTEVFDLLVVDWDLPQMTGVEICKAYRESGGETPILMLTGRSDVDDKEMAFDAGADDYLSKPFNIKEFGARVRSLLRRGKAAAASPAQSARVQAADVRVCVVCSTIFPSEVSETCPSDGGATIALRTAAVLGKEVDGYRFSKLLGAGAWSEVYLGEAAGLPPVAVKILHAHLANDPLKIARFEREASALIGISHDSIAQVISTGKLQDGRPYICMEFIDGASIDRIIRTRGCLPADSCLSIISDVCSALATAHQKGFIHRDIKPSNIFLMGDKLERIKVMDFGLAKAVTADGGALASLTQAGEVLGTPAYMSPEQVRGEPLDARTDIYALGLVLYEMLSGRRAVPGTTAFEVMTKHLSEYPSPLCEANSAVNIPAEVEDIVFKAIAKDADDRFQTVLELQSAVDSTLRDVHSTQPR